MKTPVPVGHLTETQESMWEHLFQENDPIERNNKLLKWSLARLTFYGPMNEPCANAIRVHLGEEQVR